MAVWQKVVLSGTNSIPVFIGRRGAGDYLEHQIDDFPLYTEIEAALGNFPHQGAKADILTGSGIIFSRELEEQELPIRSIWQQDYFASSVGVDVTLSGATTWIPVVLSGSSAWTVVLG